MEERHQSLAPAGNSGAGTGSSPPACLSGCEGEMAAGHRKQAEAAPAQQLPSPDTDLSAAVLIGSVGHCSWDFLPHKALPMPCQPACGGWATTLPTSPWHGTAWRAAVPWGEGKIQPRPGPAGFMLLVGVRVLPQAGFP